MHLAGRHTTVAVALLTVIGAAIRIAVVRDSLFADELATYWVVTTHGPLDVLATVHGDAEITPPLYFLLAWMTTVLGNTPELARAPSLLAGIASIPVVHWLGLRTVGRRAALVAAGIVTFSPFMIYYSAEARAYAVMMLLVMLSTLTMLVAIDTGRVRWWIAFAACSCLAVYTHYTCVFALAAQSLWLLWAHPEARRPAILANLGALAAFLPWITGLRNDLTSPTSQILSALSPFTLDSVWHSLTHWALGYPYTWVAPLTELPGTLGLLLLALALLLAAGGIAFAAARPGLRGRLALVDRRLVLVAALLLSVPVGEVVVSAVGDNLFGVRNLAASWPALALALAAAVVAAGPRLGLIAGTLTVACFALGAARLLTSEHRRPDYQAAADFIDRRAGPGDAIVDVTAVLSPGPLSPLDVTLRRPHRIFRAGAPEERASPFGFDDRPVPLAEALPRAIAAAPGGRIFFVATIFPQQIAGLERRTKRMKSEFPARYHVIEGRRYPGIAITAVTVYADRSPGGG